MFQRMTRKPEYPGTGIGLAIARKAVERMNGSISLESEPGKGTRFRIELRHGQRRCPSSTLSHANNIEPS